MNAPERRCPHPRRGDTAGTLRAATRSRAVAESVVRSAEDALDVPRELLARPIDNEPRTHSPVLNQHSTQQSENPKEKCRWLNGKKLCSECESPLGTGDAISNETLNIFLHAECSQCGTCKRMLGDTLLQADAWIQNGRLYCSECYKKSSIVSLQAPNREPKTLNTEPKQLNRESKLLNETKPLLNESKILIESKPLINESKILIESKALINESKILTIKSKSRINMSNRLINESQTPYEELKSLNEDPIQQVLVRNYLTGWYNRGRLIHHYSNDSLLVLAEDKTVKILHPKDVIHDIEDKGTVAKGGDAVMCPYPTIDVQYCPAVVLQELPMMWLQVRYYDGTEGYVAREDAYAVNDAQKQQILTDIIRKEEAVIGRTVVARNDKDGIYYIGTVAARDWTGPRFLVEWADGSQSVQEAIHMFAVLPELCNLGIGSHVLALANYHPESFAYMPGIVMKTNDKQWNVHFINGKSALLLHRNQMYRLSEKYYKLSELYFEKKQRQT